MQYNRTFDSKQHLPTPSTVGRKTLPGAESRARPNPITKLRPETRSIPRDSGVMHNFLSTSQSEASMKQQLSNGEKIPENYWTSSHPRKPQPRSRRASLSLPTWGHSPRSTRRARPGGTCSNQDNTSSVLSFFVLAPFFVQVAWKCPGWPGAIPALNGQIKGFFT